MRRSMNRACQARLHKNPLASPLPEGGRLYNEIEGQDGFVPSPKQ